MLAASTMRRRKDGDLRGPASLSDDDVPRLKPAHAGFTTYCYSLTKSINIRERKYSVHFHLDYL